MILSQRFVSLCMLLLCSTLALRGQQTDTTTFNKGRFWGCAAIGTGLYVGASIGMWESWYKGYELTSFHTFNDMGEWNDMDKVGHTVAAYNEAVLLYRGALWTGMNRRTAMWTGAGIAFGLQLTVEMMDGFSEKWGFSWGDIAFNTIRHRCLRRAGNGLGRTAHHHEDVFLAPRLPNDSLVFYQWGVPNHHPGTGF